MVRGRGVLNWARDEHGSVCAAVQSGRRVFVFGGYDGSRYLSTTAMLDLDSMVFTEGPDMLSVRSGVAAIAIDARRVLVVGELSGEGYLNTTEILDLETLTFTTGPNMEFERGKCARCAPHSRGWRME